MMLSFWSPIKNEFVSSLSVLTAFAGSTDFLCKVVMSENYLGVDNLGRHLIGESYNGLRREYDRSQSRFYGRGDSYLKFLKSKTGRNIYMGRSLEIVRDHLYFLPLNQSLRSDIYEYGFEREFHDIREYCEARFDFLFINTESFGNLSTKLVLEYSRMVVICLPTAEWVTDLVMERYASLLPKAVLVFHGDPDSGFLRRMRRKYPAFRDRMMFVPVTEDLKEAAREGRVLEYAATEWMRREEGYESKVMQKIRYLAFSIMRVEKNAEMLRYDEMRGLFSGRNKDPFGKKYSLPDKTGMVADRETV